MNWFIEFFSGDLVNQVVFWATYAVGVVIVAIWAFKALLGIGWHLSFGVGETIYVLLHVRLKTLKKRPWLILYFPVFILVMPFISGLREFLQLGTTQRQSSKRWEWRPFFHYKKRNQS